MQFRGQAAFGAALGISRLGGVVCEVLSMSSLAAATKSGFEAEAL
jgi:hypothetical protein